MGTHLIMVSESYLVIINILRFIWFSKVAVSVCFGRR